MISLIGKKLFLFNKFVTKYTINEIKYYLQDTSEQGILYACYMYVYS